MYISFNEHYIFFQERFALKKKKIHLYPQYYNLCDKLNLSTIGPPCQLLFVMSLLEMVSTIFSGLTVFGSTNQRL